MPDDRLARTRQGYEDYVYLPPVNLGHPRCSVVGQTIHIPMPERFRTTNWPLLDKVSAAWRAVYEPQAKPVAFEMQFIEHWDERGNVNMIVLDGPKIVED